MTREYSAETLAVPLAVLHCTQYVARYDLRAVGCMYVRWSCAIYGVWSVVVSSSMSREAGKTVIGVVSSFSDDEVVVANSYRKRVGAD